MGRFFNDYGLYLAWLVAMVATGGSLYFSEVRQFVPCALCWYQRIFMYPLVILLGIASFRNDRRVVPYLFSLSIVGMLIALYHVLEQNVPGFAAPPMCNVGVPCAAKYINWFGFISIPVLSLVAFGLITLLLFGSRANSRNLF